MKTIRVLTGESNVYKPYVQENATLPVFFRRGV